MVNIDLHFFLGGIAEAFESIGKEFYVHGTQGIGGEMNISMVEPGPGKPDKPFVPVELPDPRDGFLAVYKRVP